MKRGVLLLGSCAVALAFGACGDGEAATTAAGDATGTVSSTLSTETGAATDTGATTETNVTTGADPTSTDAPSYPGGGPPYCAAQYKLDFLADRVLGGLSPEEQEKALGEFVEANDDLLQELVDTAPPEIAADVELLVADLRAKAGLSDEPPPDPADVAPAEERVAEVEGELGCVD